MSYGSVHESKCCRGFYRVCPWIKGDTDDWPAHRFQALMKKLEEATTGMQTLTTKVEGLTTTVGELTTKVDNLTTTVRDLSTKVEAHSDKVGDLSTVIKGQGSKVSEIKQMMTTEIDDLNHTPTLKIDGLNTKIKDSLKAQGDLIKKVSIRPGSDPLRGPPWTG